MAGPSLFRVDGQHQGFASVRLGLSRRRPEWLAHLVSRETSNGRGADQEPTQRQLIERVLSRSELCQHLRVSAQTIYDLRCPGRGPRGFRVGRELRFRVTEIEAWLGRMESDDAQRHCGGGR